MTKTTKILTALLFVAASICMSSCSSTKHLSKASPLYDAANATVDEAEFAIQYSLNKAEWDAVFAFLADPETKNLPAGRHDITENTFANVQIDRTKETSNWEDHHKKIDLFYIVEGSELINVATPADMQEITMPYNEGRDATYSKSAANSHPVVLTPGKYVILFPSNAHQPMLAPDGKPAPLHKITVKIPYVEVK